MMDGHDTRRDPGYSESELTHIARMRDGGRPISKAGACHSSASVS
jgi:hypothetical protein